MEIVNIYRSQLDEIANRELDDYEAYDTYEIHNESLGDDMILIDGPLYHLPAYGIVIGTGTYCAYDPDSGECLPDFGLTAFYVAQENNEDIDINHPIFWEQDSPNVAMSNFLNWLEAQGQSACQFAAKIAI